MACPPNQPPDSDRLSEIERKLDMQMQRVQCQMDTLHGEVREVVGALKTMVMSWNALSNSGRVPGTVLEQLPNSVPTSSGNFASFDEPRLNHERLASLTAARDQDYLDRRLGAAAVAAGAAAAAAVATAMRHQSEWIPAPQLHHPQQVSDANIKRQPPNIEKPAAVTAQTEEIDLQPVRLDYAEATESCASVPIRRKQAVQPVDRVETGEFAVSNAACAAVSVAVAPVIAETGAQPPPSGQRRIPSHTPEGASASRNAVIQKPPSEVLFSPIAEGASARKIEQQQERSPPEVGAPVAPGIRGQGSPAPAVPLGKRSMGNPPEVGAPVVPRSRGQGSHGFVVPLDQRPTETCNEVANVSQKSPFRIDSMLKLQSGRKQKEQTKKIQPDAARGHESASLKKVGGSSDETNFQEAKESVEHESFEPEEDVGAEEAGEASADCPEKQEPPSRTAGDDDGLFDVPEVPSKRSRIPQRASPRKKRRIESEEPPDRSPQVASAPAGYPRPDSEVQPDSTPAEDVPDEVDEYTPVVDAGPAEDADGLLDDLMDDEYEPDDNIAPPTVDSEWDSQSPAPEDTEAYQPISAADLEPPPIEPTGVKAADLDPPTFDVADLEPPTFKAVDLEPPAAEPATTPAFASAPSGSGKKRRRISKLPTDESDPAAKSPQKAREAEKTASVANNTTGSMGEVSVGGNSGKANQQAKTSEKSRQPTENESSRDSPKGKGRGGRGKGRGRQPLAGNVTETPPHSRKDASQEGENPNQKKKKEWYAERYGESLKAGQQAARISREGGVCAQSRPRPKSDAGKAAWQTISRDSRSSRKAGGSGAAWAQLFDQLPSRDSSGKPRASGSGSTGGPGGVSVDAILPSL